MDTFGYKYKGKLWTSCSTTSGVNSFFHSAFGVTEEAAVYLDKQAKFRRMRWASFLTYIQNDTMPSSLADILKKCLSAKENYKHVSIDDKDSIEQYVFDVMTLEQPVTKEELPILATLENVRIVVLSHGEQDSAIVVKPNPDILGSYKNVRGKTKEVVLGLEGDTFSRLEPACEDSNVIPTCSKTNRTDSSWYRKGGGNAGSKGVEYQVNLLGLVILNTLRNSLPQWRLSTENEDAGKFDDVVLEWSDGTVLIQSKHKEDDKKKITLRDLTSTNCKHSDFSLPKYFLWSQIIKSEFNVKNVIICTNTGVHDMVLEYLDLHDANSESLLYHQDGKCSFYTLKDNIIQELKEKTISYYRQNFTDKGINESVITDENLKIFMNQLQLYFNFPSIKCIEKIIENLLSVTKFCSSSQGKISHLEIYSKLKDWFQHQGGIYLNTTNINIMFLEIWRDTLYHKLEQYKISFRRNLNLDLRGVQQIFYFTAPVRYLLQTIRIYQTIQGVKTKTLFISPNDDVDTQRLNVQTFIGDAWYVCLIIIRPKTIEESEIVDIYGGLKDILTKHKYKRIILSAEDSKLLNLIGLDEVVPSEGSVSFQDLSFICQEKLVKEKNIFFQGDTVSLEEMLKAQNVKDYSEMLNEDIMEMLIVGEQIKVGAPPIDLDEYVKIYYVNRIFKREVDKMEEEEGQTEDTDACISEEVSDLSEELTQIQEEEESDSEDEESNDENNEETFSEDKIYDVDEKLVIVADAAGMGKSTVLTRLAIIIKESNPHLWVVRIELNDYTKILNEFLTKRKESIDIIELLGSKAETELTNHLEKCLFLANQKIVLMLDGIDEISPDYTELVLGMIKHCQEESNFSKIFVTTRSHMATELEAIFKIKPFVLQPFTEQNQLDFLTSYWGHNLELKDDVSKEKCKLFAEQLIKKISWTNSDSNRDNNFASIPLHIRMAAEIFQETTRLDESINWRGCKEYIVGEEVEPSFIQTMNVRILYDLFLKRKRDIFIDKGNPTRNPAANRALMEQFDDCLIYHRNLALEVILGEDKLLHFPGYQRGNKNTETNLLKIGIVQKFNSNFHFVHRTFADYFLAEILHTELQQNQSVEFHIFLLDVMLLEIQYNMTRVFFDSFLQETVDSLSCDIFKQYQSLNQENSSKQFKSQSKLLHVLAQEGCIAILHLIIKCIDVKIIRNLEVHIKDYYEPTETEIDSDDVRPSISGNTLKVVQYLTEQAGVNIKDDKGRTPLHCASRKGHTEMVKYLIERGANINSRDDDGDTAIHIATRHGVLTIVQYLVTQEVDLNVQNNYGFTVQHLATRYGHLDIVKYFLERGLNFNVTNNNARTPLHLACDYGHLEIIKCLLAIDVNFKVRDKDGYTPQHFAARSGTLDSVKFLKQYGLDFNVTQNNGRTLLHSAGANGHLETVKFLLEAGVDLKIPNDNGNTVLQTAIYFGQLEVVKFLVEYGVDLNVLNNKGHTLLHTASGNGHLDIVKLLLQQEVDPTTTNNAGYTPLHFAARSGHLHLVTFLVEYGLDFTVTNNNGRTLLHSAASKGYLDMAKYLVELGIDYEIKNNYGNTALQIAAYYGRLEIVKYFVERGAKFNVTDKFGRTPLHSACRNGHLETVKFIFEHGMDFDTRDEDGYSALHIAARLGRLDIIKFLVGSGVDFNVKGNNDRTPLHSASARGHLETVKYMLQLGIDSSIKDNSGFTALHSAAYFGQLQIVKYLVEQGLHLDVTNKNNRSPLYSASSKGHLETVKFLVDRSNLISKISDSPHRTPLHGASANGHLEIVKFLLGLGVHTEVLNSGGYTPLHLATRYGHLDIVKLFAKYGLNFNTINNNGRTLLHSAALNGHLKTVKYLLDLDADVTIKDNFGYTVLHIAAYYGHLDVVKYLVDLGLDIKVTNNKDHTLLHSVSAKGHLEIVKFLLQFGADSNALDHKGYTILHTAVNFNQLDIVKFLIDYSLDYSVTNNDGRTLLHSVSVKGHMETAKFLQKLGLEVNIKDKEGYTAMQRAVFFGRLKLTKLFIDSGQDYNIIDHHGHTLPQIACIKGHLKTIKFFLQLGIDPNVKDEYGYTLLHLAAFYGHQKIVQFLVVEYGINLEDTNNFGRTLLHSACLKGHLDTVKYLLELGVASNIKDEDGYTALHLATACGHLDTVKFLVNHGVEINVTNNNGTRLLDSAIANGHLETIEFLQGLISDV